MSLFNIRFGCLVDLLRMRAMVLWRHIINIKLWSNTSISIQKDPFEECYAARQRLDSARF